MATDGPKIIDGDTAHDTYWGIMDMFDNEVSHEEIREEFPIEIDFYDDFNYEIYLTSLALAFWEIGLMDTFLLNKVKETIAKGVGVKEWTEECDEKTGKQRQQAFNRLVKKISKHNEKVRKPKKYRQVKNFHFHPDDLLTFKLSDGSYRAVICAKITQHRGQCTYDLVGTDYVGENKPDSQIILKYSIASSWISSGFERKETLYMQPGLEKLWEHFPRYKDMFFGVAYRLVTHKDFYGFKNKFEKVGTIKIKDSLKRNGSYGYESTFDRFEEVFGNFQDHRQTFGEKRMPIKFVIEDLG